MESLFPARDQALSLWSGSADSKTLDYQRTPNPKEYQIMRIPQRQLLVYKTYHHPTTSSTLCTPTQTTNKTKIQTESSADRITTSLSPAHQRKQNKTKHLTSTHHNTSKNHTLHKAYITGPN